MNRTEIKIEPRSAHVVPNVCKYIMQKIPYSLYAHHRRSITETMMRRTHYSEFMKLLYSECNKYNFVPLIVDKYINIESYTENMVVLKIEWLTTDSNLWKRSLWERVKAWFTKGGEG